MIFFNKLNIREKLLIIVSFLIIMLSSIISVIFIIKSNNEMMASIINRSVMLARSMSVLSANYIAGFQYMDIQRAIEDVVAKDKEIVYGFLEDINGDVLSPVFKDEVINDINKIIQSYKSITKIITKLDPFKYGYTGEVSINIVKHGNEECIDIKLPVFIGDNISSYIRFGTTLKYLKMELLKNILISIIILLLLIAIGIFSSWSFASQFSKPIMKLKDAAVEFGRKNFDYKIEIFSYDEIGVLAKTFDEMRKNIKEYSEHLEELVAQRTKELQEAYEKLKEKDRLIQMELDFASKIQKGIMPNGGYKWNNYIIYGYSQPMEKIGGDFFDIFQIPGGKLLFYIADVAGHGIPAALITTMLKISLLNISFENQDPGQMIEKLNERIRIINSDMIKDQVMANYLTIFAGTIDKDNTLTYSSGGHHKPIIYNQNKKIFKELEDLDTPLVGILDPEIFNSSSAQFKLEVGDKILLYTDGITERRNLNNKELQFEGLQQILSEGVEHNLNGKKLLSYILNSIEKFAEGVPPKDDYTLLLVEKIN